MMATYFMGVRIPNRVYERLPIEGVNVEDGTISHLREEIAKRIGTQKDEIELIYCGDTLQDDETIKGVDIPIGSTIHVFKKAKKLEPYVPKKFTEAECKKLAELFGTVCDVSLTAISRYNIIQSVLTEYPEFRKNLGAQALMKDHVLFQSLKYPENMEDVAENYPIICDAAQFIVQLIKKENEKSVPASQQEETYSDATSSSEEESSSSTSQTEQARIRRISRDQLANALLQAGTASLNSLPNIAQRNSRIAEERRRLQALQSATTSSTPSTASTTPVRITSQSFNSALTQALLAAGVGNSASQPQQQPIPQQQQLPQQEQQSQPEQPPQQQQPQSMEISESGQQSPSLEGDLETRHASALQQMREMGLSDNGVNLQALILSNGNVEAAINLVFSGMNLF